MKLIYLANMRMPTEKAHGYQTAKMCEAFADFGTDVFLVVPKRKNHIAKNIFDYYQVKKNFRFQKISCIDSVSFGRIGFLFESFTFLFSSAFFVFKKTGIFYTRDEIIAWFFSFFGKECVWEAHRGGLNFFVRGIIKRNIKIVSITKNLKDFYVSKGAKESSVFVAPDGVDIQEFSLGVSKTEARKKVGFSEDEKIVLYTGHLYEWKGVDTLALAGKTLSKDTKIVFVGGTEKDMNRFREKYKDISNVIVLGDKPHHLMPWYLASADVLILPNSGKDDISRLYTSPIKLFEYMASNRPIVASDLPSIREILNEENAVFFSPDNPESLASSVKKVLENQPLADKISRACLEKIKEYTWEKRAKNITDFIGKK